MQLFKLHDVMISGEFVVENLEKVHSILIIVFMQGCY